jgi:hypothetical protein
MNRFRVVAGRPISDSASNDGAFFVKLPLRIGAAIIAAVTLAAALLIWPRIAQSEGLRLESPYFTAGFGRGFLKHPRTNKWWIQEGFDYTYDEGSTVARIGLGIKVHKFAAIEATFHDLGEYHHFAGFMANEDLYNESTHGCNGHCEETTWGYLQGSVKAFSLSIVPQYQVTRSLSLFGRVGIAWYDAKFIYRLAGHGFERAWLANSTFSESGVTPVYGFGLTYKRLSLEATEFHGVGANALCCSAYQNALTYTVSYRWDL